SHMKKEVDPTPAVGEKRKREVFEAGENVPAADLVGHFENILNTTTLGNQTLEATQSYSIPFVDLETSLHFDSSFGLNIQPTLSQNDAHALEELSTHPRPTNRALF
ncbi:hypothetical protein A2U01_0037798, partial [Trifolium medium]|nr:hypothetical protein [Trifolium medium]